LPSVLTEDLLSSHLYPIYLETSLFFLAIWISEMRRGSLVHVRRKDAKKNKCPGLSGVDVHEPACRSHR
jgi:hypothetical protein